MPSVVGSFFFFYGLYRKFFLEALHCSPLYPISEQLTVQDKNRRSTGKTVSSGTNIQLN